MAYLTIIFGIMMFSSNCFSEEQSKVFNKISSKNAVFLSLSTLLVDAQAVMYFDRIFTEYLSLRFGYSGSIMLGPVGTYGPEIIANFFPTSSENSKLELSGGVSYFNVVQFEKIENKFSPLFMIAYRFQKPNTSGFFLGVF